MPEDMKIIRWREWDGPGLEHLVLQERAGEVSADSVAVCSGQTPFAVRYRIACDAGWRAIHRDIACPLRDMCSA
ncbi:MAG: hypothetical protein E5Y31_31305, partial [Mesorhizobium sp.]